MDKTCKFHELWLNTELMICDNPKAYAKILLAFCWGNQFHANSRSAYRVSGVQARRPPSLCQRAPPPFLLDSSLHSTHMCTHSLLHSTHLCTYSSLSAVPNVWTIYAPQPRPSACRDYIYQHSHVHVCISLCLLSDWLHSVSCTRDTSTTLPSGVSWLLFCFCLLAFDLIK